MGPRQLILTTVVPGLIVGLTLLIAWTIHARRKSEKHGPEWVAPIAFSIGFAIAFWSAVPRTRWWPATGSERFLYIAGLAMLAGLACAFVRKPPFMRYVVSAISLALAVWIMLESLPAQTLPRSGLMIWIAVVAVGGTASVALMHRSTDATAAWLPSAQFIAIAFATSAISLFSHVALFAGLAGCLVAMATASAVVNLIAKESAMAPSGTLVMYIFVAVLVVGDAQYANNPLHLAAYVLVLCAPLGPPTLKMALSRTRVTLSPNVLGMMGVLAPLIAATIIGFITQVVPEPYDY